MSQELDPQAAKMMELMLKQVLILLVNDRGGKVDLTIKGPARGQVILIYEREERCLNDRDLFDRGLR